MIDWLAPSLTKNVPTIEVMMQAAGQAGVAVTSIGMVVAGSSVPRFLDGEGREIALPRLSYSHF